MTTENTQQFLPDWINKRFFEECLQKENNKDTIEVTNFTTSSVAPPGNNYGSFIIRAKVDYKFCKNVSELQTISLIVKSEHPEGPFAELSAKNPEIQKNEPFFYYTFLPNVAKVCEPFFAPKCFPSSKPTVTILEDLKDKGFLMADRMKQLDFEHCRLYMTAAASMHAVSVAVFKHHPELLVPIYKSPMFDDTEVGRDLFILMINVGMKIFIDEVEKIDRYKHYSDLLKKTVPKLWNILVDVHKPGEGVNTIRQGDPWTTNVMFKYNKKGNASDIKLIDFQAIQYGSPAADIVFFIWTSANNDIKRNRLDELYRIYVDTFNAKLQQCNCDERLSYQQFVAEINKMSPVALFLAATMTPCLIHTKPIDFISLFSKQSEEETISFYRNYYDNNFCNNYFPHLVECLEVNGVFDYLDHYLS